MRGALLQGAGGNGSEEAVMLQLPADHQGHGEFKRYRFRPTRALASMSLFPGIGGAAAAVHSVRGSEEATEVNMSGKTMATDSIV